MKTGLKESLRALLLGYRCIIFTPVIQQSYTFKLL